MAKATKEPTVDIEEPNKDIRTVSLSKAIYEYRLQEYEVEKLKRGEVVWHGETALSIPEEPI